MALERTFSIIKPDVVKRNLIGEIYHRIEKRVCRSLPRKWFTCRKSKPVAFTLSMKANRF